MEKRKRIFIAINFPQEIKRQLLSIQREINSLFSFWQAENEGKSSQIFKWTKAENLHLTLFFLGYLKEGEILNISEAVQKTASKTPPFILEIKNIAYGPLEKKDSPRMIWAICRPSHEIKNLFEDLEKEFSALGLRESENHKFSPHITLARIRQWLWQRIEPEERPQIEKEINLSLPVQSIEIMESKLKRIGPDYTIIKSFPFCNFKQQ